MGRRADKATLLSSKGGALLAELKNKLTSANPAAAPKTTPTPRPPRVSIEEELEAAFAHRGGPLAIPKKRPAAKKQQNKERIIIHDPELRRQAIAAAKAITASPADSRMPQSNHNDLGEAAFNKLAKLRTSLDGFSATHIAGRGGSGEDDEIVRRRIAKGAEVIERVLDPDDGYFLGYDFGTSTTKVVARYPYAGTDLAFAIDVPLSIASDNQPHLWPTICWWNKANDTFGLVPEQEAHCLSSFKSALIEKSGHRICSSSTLTMAEAATAFLALHLAYCVGTCVEREERFKLAGINIGVPVAALADRATVALFEKVLRAALFLIPFAPALTTDDVRAALQVGENSPIPYTIPYTLNTELAGAIAGYCSMPRPYVGGHMIIDCGSATLDMASFVLDGRSTKPVGIFAARVDPLGADACNTFREHGASAEECKRASRFQEHLVYSRTLEFGKGGFAQEGGGFPYQIILIGGGIHSEFHEPLFVTMERAFHRQFHRPQLAPGLDFDRTCEAGRLILADGLARDPIELRDVSMPGDPPPRPSGPQMVTKDMC